MPETPELLTGEFSRAIDERFRLSIPPELLGGLGGDGVECLLTKERPGCISVWNAARWQAKFDGRIAVVNAKLHAGQLDDRLTGLQQWGRLLSTRQRTVQLAGRGRLLIPEGFREFLRVEPGGEVMIVGAAV
ncbi:MAG: division/cell wall cluster transcriptional repressor MraZ, partial [Planctomycetaceae bacterium]|nr:division/cell wall cluster transcriptional repressor MraZ [Planctomycetaceae bacterium]